APPVEASRRSPASERSGPGGLPLPNRTSCPLVSNTHACPLNNPLKQADRLDSLSVHKPRGACQTVQAVEDKRCAASDSYAAEPEKKKGPPPGMDMAIKWSNVYEDNGEDAPQPFTATPSSYQQRSSSHQTQYDLKDEDPDLAGASAKKRRVETFKQKEKRKTDMGQATSDKNFVEEEKRILRQNID
ncbi:unnamed protein product, partial [Pleuronectes platessa]